MDTKIKSARNLNGYILVYKPEHPRAMKGDNWDGYVYEHVLVAEKNINRFLSDDEAVHHLDGIKSNNRDTNVIVLLKSEHARLHGWLSKGAPYEKLYGVNWKNSGKPDSHCLKCGNPLKTGQSKFCSSECSAFHYRKVERPSLESLMNDISIIGCVKTGAKYGVSDKAIRKWINHYNRKAILSLAPSTLGEGAETTGEVQPLNNQISIQHPNE
jgi:predicted nucleic acid-binding Zn ribbon protein